VFQISERENKANLANKQIEFFSGRENVVKPVNDKFMQIPTNQTSTLDSES